MKNTYKITVGKNAGNISLGILGRKREDNTKM
jgi:hypothetical protein